MTKKSAEAADAAASAQGAWDQAWYERETIQRALSGDSKAGREALRLCCFGLTSRTLSQPLGDYLADRLHLIELAIEGDAQVIDAKGTKASRAIRDSAIATALCINQPQGHPPDAFPEWQRPLAAFGAILLEARWRPARVKEAMSEAREVLEGKLLNEREAQRILTNYKQMRSLDSALLRHLAGPKLWEKLDKYLPVT